MLSRLAIFVSCLLVLFLVLAAADKPPAQFTSSGSFSGGVATDDVALTSVRFGSHSDYTRMVLDLARRTSSGALVDANMHPLYSVRYELFPYRLVINLQDVWFDPDVEVGARPALPFTVVARENGTIKEMQVFLPSPSEFKVIEIDDPAKLCIDIRPQRGDVPVIYTVQITGHYTATEAYALVEQGNFPAGYQPSALVLGDLVVIEQAFTNAVTAAQMDAALKEMGYACVINERRGNELPQE
jgi:hypothetical protein